MKRKLFTAVALFAVMSGLAMGQSSTTNLEMEVMETEPAPLQAGEYADVWVRVTNTGSVTASDAEVRLVDEFPFHTDDRKSHWEIGELRRGDTYHIRAQVRVNENAVFGENDLEFEKTSGNQDVWITQSIPLEVRTDDRSLIVSNLDFPERVEPGSSAEMTLTLDNLAESTFRNVDISLDVAELPVAPRETSRKRISSVGPDEPQEVTFTLDVDDDADNNLHHLPIQIDYQNQAGQELTATETTGVNIGGYPNIDVAIESSDIRTTGRGEVTFRILNRGEGQARFAEITLEDSEQYEILSERSIYLGSMIADDYQTASFDVYVEDEGENLEMPVTVDYRDGEGDQVREFEIDRKLYSSSELRRYGVDQNGSIWPVALIILLVAGAGIYYWRRKRE